VGKKIFAIITKFINYYGILLTKILELVFGSFRHCYGLPPKNVNISLSIYEKIQDGFYYIWGMNRYVWTICNNVGSLLLEIILFPGKTDCWNGIETANILAVVTATAAASASNIKMAEAGILEIMSTLIVSANMKSNYNGEIIGMRRF
jgi:hypothetical protein